jgi:hypothetical protein
MKIALITNCTSSSSIPVVSYLDGVTLPKGHTHEETAQEWKTRIDKALKANEGVATVKSMYTGISFRSVLQAMDHLQGVETQLFVVSLGFGLVKAEDTIASYNINMQPPMESPSSLAGIITSEVFEPIRWWSAVNRSLGSENPIAKIIASKEYDLIVVCLTNSFLGLVAADIASATQLEGFNRVRIVGPKGTHWIQKYLRHIAKRGVMLPYTKSLNDLVPGNRNDFAQRAALHFVREVLVPNKFNGDLKEHTELVRKAMGNVTSFSDQITDELLSDTIASLKEEGVTLATEAYTKALNATNLRIPFPKFQRAWGVQEESEASTEEMDDALAALDIAGMSGSAGGDTGESITTIKLFVSAVRARGGGGFTVRDVTNWAKLYFDRRKEAIPETFASPNKLGRLLSTISSEIGVTKLTNAIGGKSYRVEGSPQ